MPCFGVATLFAFLPLRLPGQRRVLCMGLKTKIRVDSLTTGWDGGCIGQGAWLTPRRGVACLTDSTFLHGQGFLVVLRASMLRRVVLLGLNGPFRIGNVLPQRPPSGISRALSFPSGQDILVRRLSRRSARFVFGLDLRRRTAFAFDLQWQRLTHASGHSLPVHSRRRVKFAPTLSQCLVRRFSWQPVGLALAFVHAPLQQRLDLALAVSCRRLGFSPALSQRRPRLRACLPAASRLCALSRLASRVRAPRTWRRWLSQPRQRVRRRRFPRPGPVQRPRPATPPPRSCAPMREGLGPSASAFSTTSVKS